MHFESQRQRRDYYKSRPQFAGTLAAAGRKNTARQANRPVAPPEGGRWLRLHALRVRKLAERTVIPLGEIVAEEFLGAARAVHKHLREWSLGAKAIPEKGNPSWHTYTVGSNSNWNRRSTFRRGVAVPSYVTGTWRSMCFRLGCNNYTIVAPRGYRWDIDQHGLMLRGRAGEYHPDAGELRDAAGDKCRDIVRSLRERAAARRKIARDKRETAQRIAQQIAQAEREGARVCVADSIRAGNCVVGTRAWVTQHGLDPARHYTPSEILGRANGDGQRVALAVLAAVRRHRVEMERGYSILAEHGIAAPPPATPVGGGA